jgi:NAD(P)H-hydrate epimerase
MLIDLRSLQGPDGWLDSSRLHVPLVTCAEMKRLEKAADEAGLPYLQMMENAGADAARLVCQYVFGDLDRFAGGDAGAYTESAAFGGTDIAPRGGTCVAPCCRTDAAPCCGTDGPEAPLPRVLILCGKGNNGGDGYVAARHLALAGFPVAVLPVAGPPTTPDAIANYGRLPGTVGILTEASLETYLSLSAPLSRLIVIDALFGTGFRGGLDDVSARLIDRINRHRSFHRDGTAVFCLDLPSGLSGDQAEGAPGPCVQGDFTLAFHGLKPIHLNPEALPAMGGLIVADIGIGQALAGS